jgi:uncharacterized protein
MMPRIARLMAATLLCWIGLCAAQAPVPPLTAHVVDQVGLIDAAAKAELERKLADFEARKGSQVAVLVVATTVPEAIEPYALRVAEQWKLGRRKVDDGAILVVARDDRALRIEVGYGLEGVLNDATSKRIIDEVIVPRFQRNDFAGGISAGVDRMLRVIDGEPLPPAQPVSEGADFGGYLPVIAALALVVGAALRALFGRVAGSAVTGGVVAAVAWWLAGGVAIALGAGVLAMLLNLFGGMGLLRGLGGFGGGRRGGGGGGGMSGGGGGFGGGGSSGKW